MEKIRIRDKHPGSAPLIATKKTLSGTKCKIQLESRRVFKKTIRQVGTEFYNI
jgi:hypothetical protein